MLANAMASLMERERAQAALDGFAPAYEAAYAARMRTKLGLRDTRPADADLLEDLLALLAADRADWTLAWRALGGVTVADATDSRAFAALFTRREACDAWLAAYRARLASEGSDDAERRARMDRVNPQYVLRTHLAQQAIEAAERDDFSEVDRLFRVLQRPFEDATRRRGLRPPLRRRRGGRLAQLLVVSDAATVRTLSWQALWRRLGARGDATVPLAEIERRYAEPGRHYHNLAHLDACLDTFELVRGLCERPDEAELALWLHDLIWTPLGADNEERSAAWAVECCRAAGLPDELGARVAALILATRHDWPPSRAMRPSWRTWTSPRSGRRTKSSIATRRPSARSTPRCRTQPSGRGGRGFSGAFLARPAIFATPPLHEALELRARENLIRSLARLGPAIHTGPL